MKRTFHIYHNARSPYWYLWFWEDGKRKRLATKYKRAEYTQEQAQSIVSRADTESIQPKLLSISWALDYIEDRIHLEGKSPKTLEILCNALNKLKEYKGSSYNLSLFTSKEIWGFQEYALRHNCKPVTVNTYCRSLQQIFRRMVKQGLLQANPFQDFERLRENRAGIQYLSFEQVQKFLQALDEHPNQEHAHLIEIALNTGLRRSEVLYINRNDVNLKGRYFTITNIKSKIKERDTLEIPEEVMPHFIYFLDKYRNYEFPFLRCHPNTLTHVAQKILKRAGLPPSLHLHSLRHSFVTLALLKGIPIRDVQKLARHRKLSTTEIYSHDPAIAYKMPQFGFRK